MSEIRVDTITDSAGTGAPSFTYGFTGAMVSGMVAAFARTTAPTGWLACNGAAVSRTTYAALFAAIGTTYGVGDGSTTFNVPDCRGVFLRGAGSQTISGIVYTGTQGTTQGDQMQGHFHSITGTNNTVAVGATPLAGGPNFGLASVAVGSPTTDGVNGSPRAGSETRPANISLLYCISI